MGGRWHLIKALENVQYFNAKRALEKGILHGGNSFSKGMEAREYMWIKKTSSEGQATEGEMTGNWSGKVSCGQFLT